MSERKKVLVIEDDVETAKYHAQRLYLFGFDCDLAYDGRTALDMLRTREYELALVDIRLPDVSGLDISGPRTMECKEQVLAVVSWLANPRHLQNVYHACEQTFNLVENGYADEDSLYTWCHRHESRIWAWVETYRLNHSIG